MGCIPGMPDVSGMLSPEGFEDIDIGLASRILAERKDGLGE